MGISKEQAIDIAAEYLEKDGWYIRHREWEFDHRHIDLACIDKDMTSLLFVEVCNGPNSHTNHYSADDAMTTATMYIMDYHLECLPLRFDRITVKETENGTPKIKHQQNVLRINDPYVIYEQKRERDYIQRLITDNA